MARTPLAHGAWVDVRPGWVAGSGEVFDRLLAEVPWQDEQRQMYERVVRVPRLLSWYDEGAALPHPVLVAARDALGAHYAAELGGPFTTAGLCLYPTDATASPGTATGSAAAAPTTRWWRS